MENLDKRSALQIVRKVLAADLSCESKYFEEEGTFVFEARKLEGRRAFPFRTQSLGIVTMGIGTVINCDLPRIKWIKENLCPLGRDRLFSASTIASIEHFLSQDGQYLAGPDLKYACSTDTFRPSPLPEQIDLQLIKKEDIPGLYAHEGFRNALCYELDSARPDVLAVIARQDKKIVGIAGASADCVKIWQIGVDILPEYRGHGIGKALVSSLTEEIIQRGKVPYYSTVISNLSSRNLAIGIGYWPIWTELYARDKR